MPSSMLGDLKAASSMQRGLQRCAGCTYPYAECRCNMLSLCVWYGMKLLVTAGNLVL